MPDPNPHATSFATIFHEELAEIHRSRQKRLNEAPGAPPPTGSSLEEARKQALDMNLVGVAFCGGGIRSATFNLGVLQALAAMRFLGRIDYLSAVSGGGYVAGW